MDKKELIKAVEKLTGVVCRTEKEIVGELIGYLNSKGAGDLIVDHDIEMLLDMCIIYSDVKAAEIMTTEVMKDLETVDYYKRDGARLLPKQLVKDRRVIERISDPVINLHPDLHPSLKKHGVAFLDAVNVVVSFEHLRPLKELPNEVSGKVVFPRIRTKEDFERLIPERYRDKTWIFKTFRKKYSRLEGRYFTATEFLDLITERRLITHGNNR